MKVWSLSTIKSKQTWDWGCNDLIRQHYGNWRQTRFIECIGINKEIIHKLSNGSTRGFCRIKNQTRPQQDDPKYISAGPDFQKWLKVSIFT